MPKPSKPTNVIELEGRTHLSKSTIEYRKSAEKAMQTGKEFSESQAVKSDATAHKEFMRLKKLFSAIEFVDALDQQVINRYCLELAQCDRLEAMADEMRERIEKEPDINAADLSQAYKAIAGVLSCQNKSKELLLKYEDRLFLNPMTRIRSVPKTPQKEEKPSGIAAYRAKRAER